MVNSIFLSSFCYSFAQSFFGGVLFNNLFAIPNRAVTEKKKVLPPFLLQGTWIGHAGDRHTFWVLVQTAKWPCMVSFPVSWTHSLPKIYSFLLLSSSPSVFFHGHQYLRSAKILFKSFRFRTCRFSLSSRLFAGFWLVAWVLPGGPVACQCSHGMHRGNEPSRLPLHRFVLHLTCSRRRLLHTRRHCNGPSLHKPCPSEYTPKLIPNNKRKSRELIVFGQCLLSSLHKQDDFTFPIKLQFPVVHWKASFVNFHWQLN